MLVLECQNLKAVMVIVHGFGEHSGRYIEMTLRFEAEMTSCYTMDLRKHGSSRRPKMNPESFDYFDYYIKDLKAYVSMVKKLEPQKKDIHARGQP